MFVGRKSIEGDGIAICDVIGGNISTGDAIVFNRETGSIETLPLEEKLVLPENVRKLAEETGGVFMGDEKRFQDECNEIARFCEEQGLPTYGDTYELMVEEARAFYLGNDGSNK